MITEAISFCQELDLLEAHLEESQHWVDRIVVIESPVMFSSVPKPLYFDENRERFKRFNVDHIVTPPEAFEAIPYSYPKEEIQRWFQTRRNNRDRNRSLHWDEVRKDTDYVFMSDTDEFVSSKQAHILLDILEPKNYQYISVTTQKFSYFVNAKGSQTTQYRITRADLPGFRMQKGTPRMATPEIGWHFTNCMNAKDIQTKIYGICCHMGLSPARVPSVDEVQNRLDNFIEPIIGTDIRIGIQEVLSREDRSWAPKFMQDNPEVFPWYVK